MVRPVPAFGLVLSGLLLGVLATPTRGGEAVKPLLPDLTVLRSELQRTWRITRSRGRKRLRFTTALVNTGRGPVEVRGRRGSRTEPFQGTQHVFQSDGSVKTYPVGEFEYHPAHRHWHVLKVANYRVIDSTGKDAGIANKVSFCLADDKPVYRDLPGAPRGRRYDACASNRGALKLRNGLSVGWGDFYDQSVPDQWVDITGVPAGSYTLQVEVNPDNVLMESTRSNNIASVPVTIR